MSSPWLAIPLQDYEGHMCSIGQLQGLAELFGSVLREFKPESVALLGVAGGNGLEHIQPQVTRRICAVDINRQYLESVAGRWKNLPGLELYCVDLSREDAVEIEPVDLVYAALIFEHTGLIPAIRHAAALVKPGGVLSVVVQLPSSISDANISQTPYASMASLRDRFRLIPPAEIQQNLEDCSFHLRAERQISLPRGKGFWMGIFSKKIDMPDANEKEPEAAPVPDYSEDGVDLSLVRWMLSLSPAERLQFLDDRIDDILTIRSLNARE